MLYSPTEPLVSRRFAKLFAFCLRRGLRIRISENRKWSCSPSAVYVIAEEIEGDKDEGLFSFAHELGHIFLTGVCSIDSWFKRLYRKKNLLRFLGLGMVLTRELLAWVGGFFVLVLLGIQFPPRAYAKDALAKTRTFL